MIEEFKDVDFENIKSGDFLLTTRREIDYAFYDLDHEHYYLDSINIYDNPYPSEILYVTSVNRSDREQPQKISSINANATDGRASWLRHNYYVRKFKSLALEASNLQEFKEVYRKYLHEKMQQGDLDAMVLLGEYLKNSGSNDYYTHDDIQKTAKKYLESASERGHAYASYLLSQQYRMTLSPNNAKYYAENRPENYKFYIERSAKQGNRTALCILAYNHQYGKEGYPEDAKKAFELYSLSAEQDYPYATCNVGDKYEHGAGVELNYEKAFEYYQRAAKYRIPQALFRIGNLYLEGKGVAKDIEQAKIWLEQAAFYDDKNAKKVLRRLKSNS